MYSSPGNKKYLKSVYSTKLVTLKKYQAVVKFLISQISGFFKPEEKIVGLIVLLSCFLKTALFWESFRNLVSIQKNSNSAGVSSCAIEYLTHNFIGESNNTIAQW